MRLAKVIAIAGFLAMASVLIYGFVEGDFASDGASLLENPWGIVSMVDLYTGFVLFSGWIIFRENSFSRAFIWVVLMMVLGFFTASLYALIALYKCDGDWKRFWFGARCNDHITGAI